MATVNREAIDTFMSITGAPEAVATQRLQEFGGNLNEAVNAHFSEGDRNVMQEASITGTTTPNDLMDIDDPPVTEPHGPASLLSAARGTNPFSILDPAFGRSLFETRNLFDTSSEIMGRAPFVSQPREVREIPIEVKDGGENLAAPSGHGPRIEDVTDSIDAEGPQTHGTVIVEDEDDDIIPGNLGGGWNSSRPSAPQFDDSRDYATNDIEEEMIRAAIEASKRDTELQTTQGLDNVSRQQVPPQRDDVELEHAVSLSLKTAEQEVLQRETSLKAGASGSTANEPLEVEELGKIEESNRRQDVSSSDKPSSIHHKKEAGSSSIQDEADDMDEQPLVRNRSRRRSSASTAQGEVAESDVSPVLDPPQTNVASETHPNGTAFPSDEWGGISSVEHDEAVMLEAAMFGGIPEGGFRAPYAPNHLMHPGFGTSWRMPRPPSPGLVAQRAIREQQDDEYLAALEADREREMKAVEEEKAAREAALEEQRLKEEESRRKLEEEQELERQLAAKEASLPEEPSSNNENAVTLLIRMPDGSRRGRRFLKSDKLQSLFDFVDIGKAVKPGSYRLVRPYPRQAFSSGECNVTLNDLGLTSKQEALFLELI
ncbi:plant UBX domain-containing protein 8-like [Chenopodium quinoa]|uniref:plant UBX domain-containing protein 8-like n=1 Tax=Chenopodium quinoa TaxID=63459 RepID=UPI000B78E104|nr:plant UBX domain-containing protein 8-like [Chenopodium quinoa]